ncbi:MAG TPA: UbiH/UbiF/VisC/COQ6 family ubiquinone biosynthesis hydroxylase [Stellaceae bacterium]|jgi:2-octaprenyl-6-methoxyphenol hydroxylase|nr:UbiH/UbiF/VisC/COQ6 family ubiquinone biosynthesis hydroxylase [Stellaceae bacterium]
MSEDVELLIAGGGLNGMVLGIACADAGLRVAVVDRQDPKTMLGEKFDGRTSAIAYGSKLVLDGIGVWPMVAAKAEPIREIRVADDDSPLFLHYDQKELGPGSSNNAPLGYIVENRVLRRALFERAKALPSFSLLAPRVVGTVTSDTGSAVATLGDATRIHARLVAAADGKDSPLRQAAGIRTVEWRYKQAGIVTTVAHERPHAGIAIEHFLPAGPFAILPMTDEPSMDAALPRRGRSSIVWTENASLAPHLVKLPEAEFAVELGARFGDFLGRIEPVGPRWTYPLSLMQAERYTARRLALVGEAAHVIHPIAGQGLNVGIRDCAALAEAVIDARRLGLDIGDDHVLERYQRWRRLDAVLLAGVTDGLNRLFSNRIAPLKLLRDMGLAAVNKMPPLKRLLMQHAMGTLGDRPRLARGERL